MENLLTFFVCCVIVVIQQYKEGCFLNWKFTGNMPVYQQIMSTIQGAVLAGEFRPGDKFPSVRDLAMTAMVNPNTMQRALQELERMGILITDGTNGRHVTRDTGVIEALRERCIQELTQECLARFAALGISAEEAGQLLMQQKEA